MSLARDNHRLRSPLLSRHVQSKHHRGALRPHGAAETGPQVAPRISVAACCFAEVLTVQKNQDTGLEPTQEPYCLTSQCSSRDQMKDRIVHSVLCRGGGGATALPGPTVEEEPTASAASGHINMLLLLTIQRPELLPLVVERSVKSLD